MTSPQPLLRLRRYCVSFWSVLILAAGFSTFHRLVAEQEKAASVRPFDIPSDAADKSLKRFSVQSALDVAYGTETTAQVRTNAVKGDYTPREAIGRLLAGTGLIAEADDKTGALTVSRDPNAQRTAPSTAGARPGNQDKSAASKNLQKP